jgi:uncharacterized protein (TIGR03000 family)
MHWHRPRLVAVVVTLAFGLVAAGQAKKAPATIKLLLPENSTKVTLKVEGKELEANEKATKEGIRVLVTPELDPAKTYAYKIEAVIEPNNYTKIERTREITFKAGQEVTVDLRKKDDKIKDNIVIRWVPTPKLVVEDMCKLAKVGMDDVVMDPGCGDAIMLITAMQSFKAKRGIGTDIDAEKVRTSQENVEKAGLKDKVTIKEANALKLGAEDLKDVTVMMLYMGNDFNLSFRPILWEHLKPGSRIVSHRFIMGDWKPDKSITVNREGDYGVEDFHLHVWTVTGKEKTGDYPKVDPTTLDQ